MNKCIKCGQDNLFVFEELVISGNQIILCRNCHAEFIEFQQVQNRKLNLWSGLKEIPDQEIRNKLALFKDAYELIKHKKDNPLVIRIERFINDTQEYLDIRKKLH